MQDLLQQFSETYAQRAALEALILAGLAGVLGPWILMRGLGFFAHAIGSASFPGLVFADAVGLFPQAGAALGSAVVASGAGVVRPSVRNGTRTALWLTGAMAVGALIASDWSKAGAGVDAALFGSLLTSDWADLATGLLALLAAASATAIAGPRWLAQGLLHRKPKSWDALLLLVTALAVIAQLPATGALLASTMLVLPAAAARPWARSISRWQILTGSIGTFVGIGGLAASIAFDTPPGATIALLAGLVVVGSVCVSRLRPRIGKTVLVAAAGVVPLALISGCSASKKSSVVTGTPIVASITQSVAGPTVAVSSLVPSGADPHSWEPRPSDTAALAKAKMLILSGGGLDAWGSRLHTRTDSSAAVIDLYPNLPVRLKMEDSDRPDPHWFHDPTNAAAASQLIASALSKLYPSEAQSFKARADAFSKQALSLQSQGQACIQRLSPDERRLITDHDAFRYLANRLGLTIQGALLSSQSTAAAPTPKELDEILNEIKTYNVRAVFPERSLDSRLARNLAKQANVSSDTQLDSDTLGPAGAADSTWAGMWAGNVTRLTSALSGGQVTCKFKDSQ